MNLSLPDDPVFVELDSTLTVEEEQPVDRVLVIAFITDFSVVDRIINHLKLTLRDASLPSQPNLDIFWVVIHNPPRWFE